MSDSISEGFITLQEAFQIQFQQRYGTAPDYTLGGWSEKEQLICQDLVSAFANRKLEAFYRVAGSDENKRIPPESWGDETPIMEVLFREGDVPHVSPPSLWFELSGKTPFVNEQQFGLWSYQSVHAIRIGRGTDSNPMEKELWSIGEVITWIAWRDVEFVTKFLDEPFCELQLEYSVSVNEHLLGNPDFSDYKSCLSPQRAYDELCSHCLEGTVSAMAVKVEEDTPCEIPKLEWSHLIIENLSTDDALLVNCLRVEGGRPIYRDVKFRRADIVRNWMSVEEEFETTSKPRIIGRRPKYDWSSLVAEAENQLQEEGMFDPKLDPKWNQAALEKRMRDWANKNWGTMPSESRIRHYVVKAVRKYKEAYNSGE